MKAVAGLATVLARGQAGAFEGSEDDSVVFGAYRRDGRWSEDLVALLSKLVGDGGTLLDAGAHVGLVCIPVVERCGGQALAFEPEPTNYAFLRRNVARHGMKGKIGVLRRDVLSWKPAPGEQYQCVSANLFSDVLMAAFPVIESVIAPGGALVVSGILADQAEQCLAAGAAAGIHFEKVVRRGKWVSARGVVAG